MEEEKYGYLKAALSDKQVKQLQSKTVTIVGLGGIGSTLADLCVRSGINVRLVEKDRVKEEDMDRLSMFREKDVSKFKATQSKKILQKTNPDVKIKSFNEEITDQSLFLLKSDLVLDCTGNEELSPKIGDYCIEEGIPCIVGVIRDHRAIVAVATEKTSAYSRISKVKIKKSEGLLPAATHLVASFMHIKTLKILTGTKPKRGIVIYDAWKQQFEDKNGKKK